MGSILWIPVVLSLATAYLYFLSMSAPSLKEQDSNVLKFPSSLEDLTKVAKLLNKYKSENFLFVFILFCSAYLYKQTFAIPGSVFMNLLGGAIFGRFYGFILACFLSATGATCCFMLSKFFAKHYVLKYFPEKVNLIRKKIEENNDGLMPYNFICVETGTTLSSLTSLDDLLSAKTLLSMGTAAIVALVPGYLIKRRQQKRELSKMS
ncbi:DgyrCDS7467 [Dimorphilus gyrociliatus]|uniref:DgyrCDS7467 n=1 Tax=Dimorphilus gyrociliatus TaxID=2664684 RepID=A0A7I8VR86_9ANNE|nr:DgyrCDS7467 [Dimorphilus gyrociliatus]